MDSGVENLVKEGTVWLPKSASSFSDRVDLLFYVIGWGSIVLLLLMSAVGLYFCLKYKRTPFNNKPSDQVTHNTKLELAWTIIPLILVMVIFYFGYNDYLLMSTPPKDAIDVKVSGKKWIWEFEYPEHGVKTLNEFVVPVNQPVRLIMSAEDVIHSFFVPSFRIKKDVLPNRYTTIWFETDQTGEYQVFCTEYCGDGHSGMLAVLKVVSWGDYQEWLQKGSAGANDAMPLMELGEKLYTSKACNTCHSLDGVSGVGPSWKGMYEALLVSEGADVKVQNYLREAIVEPQKVIAKGYAPVMPSYSGLLSDREIDAIIEYIKSIK